MARRLPVLLCGGLAVVGIAVASLPPGSVPAGAGTTTTSTTGAPPLQSEWTRITDEDGRNIDEVGVARTGDGGLHVLWRRPATSGRGDEIVHTPLSASGDVGSTVVASGPWASAGNPAVIVTDDGGLRTFFGGLTGTSARADGVQSASAPAKGQSWTAHDGRVSSTTSAVPEGVGAALRPDGTPVFAYAHSFTLGLHVGLDPATPDTDLNPTNQCCDYLPNLVFTEDGTGVLAWFSNAAGEVGTWTQTIAPDPATKVLAPRSATDGDAVAPSQRTPVVVRAGSDEIHVAYCAGYPTCTEALVWRVGSTAPVVAGTGRDLEVVNVASDPDGRLWVMWEDAIDRSLHAVRSNPDGDAFGAEVVFAPPSGTTSVWKLQGDATADALDVFASVTTSGALATWHTAVPPGLEVSTAREGSRVVFTVTDAGEPVAKAKISVGKKTATTNKRGEATVRGARGDAEVTRSGYAPAVVTVSGA